MRGTEPRRRAPGLLSLGLFLLAGLSCCGAQTIRPAPEGSGPAATPVRTSPRERCAGWLGDGTGRYPDASPPLEWDGASGKNVVWSLDGLPNRFSSQIFVDGRIFLIAEPSLLVCVDAETGKTLWERTNDFGDLPNAVAGKPGGGDPANATPTPASDGDHVYAVFGSGIVSCYDLAGERKWIRHVAGDPPQHGRSASPVVVGDRLIVSLGHLTALDAKTGRQLWKADDWKAVEVGETYGTPARARIAGIDVVIAPGGEVVRVFDGAVLAASDGMLGFASPIISDGVAYFMESVALALELPAEAAEKLQLRRAWECSLEGTFYASSVLAEGLLFAASDEGEIFIVDASDGKVLARKDLPIASARAGEHVYGSIGYAGGHVFVSNTAGETLVLEPAREYKEVGVNRLPEGSGGTPTFAGNRMYVRGKTALYCIGEK